MLDFSQRRKSKIFWNIHKEPSFDWQSTRKMTMTRPYLQPRILFLSQPSECHRWHQLQEFSYLIGHSIESLSNPTCEPWKLADSKVLSNKRGNVLNYTMHNMDTNKYTFRTGWRKIIQYAGRYYDEGHNPDAPRIGIPSNGPQSRSTVWLSNPRRRGARPFNRPSVIFSVASRRSSIMHLIWYTTRRG